MQSYNEQAMEEQEEYTADEELEESQTMTNESEEVCCEFNGKQNCFKIWIDSIAGQELMQLCQCWIVGGITLYIKR